MTKFGFEVTFRIKLETSSFAQGGDSECIKKYLDLFSFLA